MLDREALLTIYRQAAEHKPDPTTPVQVIVGPDEWKKTISYAKEKQGVRLDIS